MVVSWMLFLFVIERSTDAKRSENLDWTIWKRFVKDTNDGSKLTRKIPGISDFLVPAEEQNVIEKSHDDCKVKEF